MSDPQAIIARCTRNGVTSWQHVANQMGCSVDAARKAHDPSYLHVRPWPYPCEAISKRPEPEPIDEKDVSSPYVKGPGMRAKIAELLDWQMMTAEILAAFLGTTPNSIRARLDRMLSDGLVFHDGGLPRSWGLTAANGEPRKYSSGAVGLEAIGGLTGAVVSVLGPQASAGRRAAHRSDA